jgi:hypothetical protein
MGRGVLVAVALGLSLGLGLGLGAPTAQAQVNTEKLRSKKKKEGVHGFVDLSVLWQTGNTNLLQVGAGARLEYNRGVHHPFLQGSYNIGQKDDAKYLHNGFLHARWPAMWHERVGSEVFTQLEFDEFKLLELRALGGAGVRVAAVLREHFELHLGSGYMFEYEDIEKEDLGLHPMAGLHDARHPEKTYHHRWTNYLSLRVDVKKWLRLTNIVYAQPRFDEFSDVRVLEDFSALFKVHKALKLVLNFLLEWDSDPPLEVHALNTTFTVRLRYKF